METDKLRAEKREVLQGYLGRTWRAEDGAAGSFRTVDSRSGFYPAHVFWVHTRQEYDAERAIRLDDGRVVGTIHRAPLETIPRNGVDYLIFGEHSIEDLRRQREANLEREKNAEGRGT